MTLSGTVHIAREMVATGKSPLPLLDDLDRHIAAATQWINDIQRYSENIRLQFSSVDLKECLHYALSGNDQRRKVSSLPEIIDCPMAPQTRVDPVLTTLILMELLTQLDLAWSHQDTSSLPVYERSASIHFERSKDSPFLELKLQTHGFRLSTQESRSDCRDLSPTQHTALLDMIRFVMRLFQGEMIHTLENGPHAIETIRLRFRIENEPKTC